MLVLSRMVGQGVTLNLPNGETVKLKILTYKGPHTQIGIIAPKSVIILRDELVKQHENYSQGINA
jgi:carbon storage regulator CsrA